MSITLPSSLRFEKLAGIVVATSLVCSALYAQSQRTDSADTQFEIASVKPNKSGTAQMRWSFEGGRFTATNVTLKTLISSGYGTPQQPLPTFQISGGPKWLDADRFDVLAKTRDNPQIEGNILPPSVLPMLRALLEERFSLRIHYEARQLPIYAVVFSREGGKPGPGMRPTTLDCAAIRTARARGEQLTTEDCGGRTFPGSVSARGISMPQLISGLARLIPDVDRPVIDETGLTGTFDIDLTWLPDHLPLSNADGITPPTPVPPIDSNAPSLFTALREQLGLKLVSKKGVVNVLVIDKVEQPTGN